MFFDIKNNFVSYLNYISIKFQIFLIFQIVDLPLQVKPQVEFNLDKFDVSEYSTVNGTVKYLTSIEL